MEKVMPVKPVTHLSEILDMYNTQYTCIHMVWNHLGFGGVPTLRSPSPVKPKTRWRKVKVAVYLYDRSRKGVGRWIFLLGCVRLGHRKTQNQDPPHPLPRFPPFRPKWEFRAISPGTPYGESDAGEDGHTPE